LNSCVIGFCELRDASIERPSQIQSFAALQKWPARESFKIAVSCFLFAIYLWGILGDVVVTAAHALDHLLTQSASQQISNDLHTSGNHTHGHSHGEILDHALASVGKKESRDDSSASPPTLRLSRCFDHLHQPIIFFHDLQNASSQFRLVKSNTYSEILQEPLISPPEIA
jgi:hypothetical protein